MTTLTGSASAGERLLKLAEQLAAAPGFEGVLAALNQGNAATLDGAWGSSCALAAAALARHAPGPLVAVAPSASELDGLVEELTLFSTRPIEVLPAWESLPGERIIHDEVFGQRLRLLKRLLALAAARRGEWPVVATCVQALVAPAPARGRLAERTRRLARGERLDVAAFARWLAEHRFHPTTAVELPGEFSVRGGILDLWAPDWDDPVRLDLFDDEIESLRRFHVTTQRSLATLDEVEVTILDPAAATGDHFTSYLPPSSWVFLVEPRRIEEEGRHYLERLGAPAEFYSVSETLRRACQFPSVVAEPLSAGSFDVHCPLRMESVERFSGEISKVRGELEAAGGRDEVFVICQTQAEAHRLSDLFAESKLLAQGRLHFALGQLRAGFRFVDAGAVLVGSGELFQRSDVRRGTRRRLGRVIDSFLELREGDYVVHLAHGIARYRGLKLLEKNERAEEHLELEFQEGTRLYVPVSKIELVQKYVGGTRGRPALSKLGGRGWQKRKDAAQLAVADLAGDLLDLQAVRSARPGIAFPADTEWQRDFDHAFPYQETPDQLTAIADVKADMLAPRPMDRLICGDVGYGKTEVAMRAAFKAVDAGYQVAVLAPTTILADQHFRTFQARLSGFPFHIRALSRFLTRGEQNRVVRDLAAGQVDIVIGTHRLASPDVQFANLGLVVIDEEQRFGVDVKERLKTLRATVDVLTLTATPIPRTLHMSLLGIRDISNLETPPEDRLAVETRITRFEPSLVRHAIIRELSRGGQMFFVHNRIHDIHRVADRLREIVPELRIGVAHGRMHEHDLEDVMLGFVNRQFDLLLATTIIESGLDIPNANTIFIDDADIYGLADLHQLRGRVGRYKHRAYCYLLLDPAKHLHETAARRLRAIEEFSDIGAGFSLAMRDLEIRGAGNILGPQQSGHIAAVGYELYCQLLEQSVRQMKKLPPKMTVDVDLDLPLEAYFPRDYVPDMRLKIDLYRRLSRVGAPHELADFREELVDRFGPPPPVVERLLRTFDLRIDAQIWQVSAIRLEPPYAVLEYASRPRIEQLARRAKGGLRIVDERHAYAPLGNDHADPDRLLTRLQALLRSD